MLHQFLDILLNVLIQSVIPNPFLAGETRNPGLSNPINRGLPELQLK